MILIAVQKRWTYLPAWVSYVLCNIFYLFSIMYFVNIWMRHVKIDSFAFVTSCFLLSHSFFLYSWSFLWRALSFFWFILLCNWREKKKKKCMWCQGYINIHQDIEVPLRMICHYRIKKVHYTMMIWIFFLGIWWGIISMNCML